MCKKRIFLGKAKQHGLMYLALILAVAILASTLAFTSQLWSTRLRRDQEKELLLIGHQFRDAISRYYEKTPGIPKQYPQSLDDLLQDNRQPGTVRFLRKIYIDPLTHQAEWGVVKTPSGAIMGVYSLSNQKPLKTAGFDLQDASFEGKEKYSEWQFMFQPVLDNTISSASN